jgi:hypothetical protein
MLRQLITDDDDDGNDDGGGGNSDSRRTNNMKAHNSGHSRDTVGNSGKGSIRIHMGNIHNSLPDLRTQFLPKYQRQNAVLERKPVPLPPMQLREVFSNSLFYLPIIKQQVRGKVSCLFGRPDLGITCNANTLPNPLIRNAIETHRIESALRAAARKCNHRSSS